MKPKSFDGHLINDGANYVSVCLADFAGLPQVNPQLSARQGAWPTMAGIERPGKTLTVKIGVTGADKATLSEQLCAWLSPEDETPKRLVITNDNGSNERYVMALCLACQAVTNAAGAAYIAIFAVSGDVRWRETAPATDTWNITASGQTKVITNNGKDRAYPVLKIKPTSNKSSGAYAYKRWMPVRWNNSGTATYYPVDITNGALDTATLVSGGKMQADGDDLRVMVDGVEVDRWLSGVNTANTRVWVNLSFGPQALATVGTAIASSGTITEIQASSPISAFPTTGILIIDSEAFSYTGKSDALQRFTGVSRAARGTSMAAHDTMDTVWWVQHDVWILYGNPSATAPVTNDYYKPSFNLASSNTSWDYDNFGRGGSQSGRFSGQVVYGAPTFWIDGSATLGITCDGINEQGRALLYNPCGITWADFQNGTRSMTLAPGGAYSDWSARLESSANGTSWALEYTIANPNAGGGTWSRNEQLTSGATWVAMYLNAGPGGYALDANIASLAAGDVTLSLNSSYTPTVTIGAEQTNYSLVATITNQTTGQAILVTYDMQLNQEIEVDTDAKSVIYLATGEGAFQTLSLAGGVRRDWLALAVGSNTLRFDDTGTAGVTVTLEWEERYYT